ncbi:MAG: cell division protein ftsK, segregation ATPase FtsK/SpoIIIE, family [Candidatus Parcubacteria bacterium]|jgi:S-DNA-T family DNA segregation ATPase FtsK/SpoIIIE
MKDKVSLETLKIQVEELSGQIKALSERHNAHYTDIMLEVKEAKDQIANTLKGLPDDRTEDELYEEAYDAVVEIGKASTSYLQRALGLGYARAARLMDTLEEKGVIGPGKGIKPRKVLIKPVNE